MDTNQRTAEHTTRMAHAARAVTQALLDFGAACARCATIMQSFNVNYMRAENLKVGDMIKLPASFEEEVGKLLPPA